MKLIHFVRRKKVVKIIFKSFVVILYLAIVSVVGSFAADAKPGTLTCVGLYSETDAGSISYRTGTAAWIVIKVGDVIPANAEIKINVDRDWIELIPSNNPRLVFEIDGSEKGDVVQKVAEILKGKSKSVSFPKESANMDPGFKDKMVVTRYLGRQKYKATPTSPANDIKYGDILDSKGSVNIIAINNTLTLMYPNGSVATIVGPIKFDVAKMFTKENLYKYLNVAK
jgi:hypothetical protein